MYISMQYQVYIVRPWKYNYLFFKVHPGLAWIGVGQFGRPMDGWTTIAVVPVVTKINPTIRYIRRIPSSNLPIGTARIFSPRENVCTPA